MQRQQGNGHAINPAHDVALVLCGDAALGDPEANEIEALPRRFNCLERQRAPDGLDLGDIMADRNADGVRG